MFCNVRDFGAAGDGTTSDTAAIQAAVDRVREAGAGEVFFPPGTYRSGTIVLAGNLTLRLAAGATLAASPEAAEYPPDTALDLTYLWLRHYLLLGRGLANLTICGEGRIDGSGDCFWEEEYFSGNTDATLPPEEERSPISYEVYKPKAMRPVVIYLVDCVDVAIRDLHIVNAAAYTVWTLGCRRVLIQGITVRNRRSGPNTDILDIDSSQQVRICDCDLEAGDDCIALKSDAHRLGRISPCEDIVVSNCVLSSATCAIRVGYEGDAPIRDCVFSNLAIRNTRHAIDIISIAPAPFVHSIKRGTPIERLVFSNITMRNVAQAFFIWAGNEEPRRDYAGYIRNLEFSGIFADCVATSYIGSKDHAAIRDLNFRDVALNIRDTAPEIPWDSDVQTVPSHWGGGWKAGGLRLRRVERVSMSNCRIAVENSPHPALHWSEVDDFAIDGDPQTPSGRII